MTSWWALNITACIVCITLLQALPLPLSKGMRCALSLPASPSLSLVCVQLLHAVSASMDDFCKPEAAASKPSAASQGVLFMCLPKPPANLQWLWQACL